MAIAAGSDRQIQFNSGGNLSASDYLTFDSTNQLVMGNNAPLNRVPTDGYRSQIAFKKYKADNLTAFGVKLARSDPSQPHLAIIDSQVEQLQLNNGGFYITRRRASALTLNTGSFDPRYADGSLKTSYTDSKPYDSVFAVSMYEPRDVPNAQVGDVNVIPNGLEATGWYNLLAVSRQGDLTVAMGQIRTNNDISTFNGNVYASNQLLGGNLRVPGFARFSTAGNVYIPGGTIGQILSCDDINGKLKWINNSSAPIKVKDEGALITPGATEFNFVGAGVTATASLAGAVTVTIPSTAVAVADEGTSLTSTATRLNFVGTGVTATATAGNVTITIPGSAGANIAVQDEGVALTNAVSRFNFVGTGVTADASGSNVTVTIPGGGSSLAVQDEGANVVASANTVNFVGAGVTASNVGGVATVTIPGNSYALAIKDEGNTISSTANVINFVGTGVTATQASANNVTVTINSSSLTTQDEGVNIANATTKFNFVGSGVTATGVGNSDVTVTIPGNSVKVYDATGAVITNNLKELRLNAALASTGNTPDNGVVTVAAPTGSGSGIPVATSNKGTLLTSATTGINFLGSGISAAISSGNNISVTVPGFSGITVQDEGSVISSSALQFNFVGAGVTATGTGSNITVTVPGPTSTLITQDEGSTVVASTGTINFVGAGITASNVGGVATVTVPALVTQDEGGDIVAVTDKINFVGAGVTATNVGGVATVSIPGTNVPALITQDEGYEVVSSTTTLNFVGAGVTATNVGGAATVTIPGSPALNIQDEGSVIATDAYSINFVGTGVTATGVANAVTVNIPGGDTLYDAGSGSGALTFNRNNGTIQKFTLTGAATSLAITNIAPAQSFTIIFKQDGAGSRTLSTSGFKFASNYRTLSTAANAEDMLNIFFDGSTYYCTLTTGYV